MIRDLVEDSFFIGCIRRAAREMRLFWRHQIAESAIIGFVFAKPGRGKTLS
ncbi:MAG: hypothetical protein PHS37_08400 [Candidatus Omnitrophica bacterium]|nr:hypothetical protein [Candidatus Omnitrophota bacterium]